jgi:antitoxin component of RelBE/YafQ-DinJ toxin-antitoxin module
MRTKLLGLKCSPNEKLSLIGTFKEQGFTISEAFQLFVAHVAYLNDLPFQVQTVSDGKVSRKKTSALLFVVNPLHYEKFQATCERLGLTKSQALHLFVQYCVQHRDIPTLFRPDAKVINKPVLVSSKGTGGHNES